MKYKKGIKVAMIVSIIIFLLSIFFWYYRFIPVKYIGYALETREVSAPGFYATLSVKTTQENMQKAIAEGAYSEADEIIKKLEEFPEDQRIVVSWGKRINYFYYFGNEKKPTVYVEYQDDEIENKIYFYTINYEGAIIDYVNY